MSAYAATVLFVGFLVAALVLGACAILQVLWRKRHNVLGSRVRAPEWKARRLRNGQWIVERTRKP